MKPGKSNIVLSVIIASQAEWYVNAEKDLDEKYFILKVCMMSVS